jgi:ATP-binding cassette, subfamily B, multidrug efflux pump
MLLRYLKPYRKESILAPLFKLLEALMDLIVPVAVAAIIDKGIAKGNKPVIFTNFAIMIILAAAGLAFSITAQWFAARASVGFSTGLRQDLYDHIMRLSLKEIDKHGRDTLITRMTSDVNTLQNGVNMALRLLLRSPFIVAGSMIMSFLIDAKTAMIFAFVVPLLAVTIFLIMRYTIPLYRKVQSRLDVLLGRTRENLTGARVIRAFSREPAEVKEFDRENDDLTRLNEFTGRLSALMNPMTFAIINIGIIVLIKTGAVRINSGAIGQGSVVAMYNYMAQMVIELVKMAGLLVTLNRGWASGDRIAEILKTDPGMTYPDKADDSVKEESESKDAVSFSNVSLKYSETGDDAIKNITFTVKPGQTVGIIGGTGSGKSSLVNLIPRFYDATEGSVSLFGHDVRDYDKDTLNDLVAVVPQKAVLFSGSIRDNLLMGRKASDEEIMNSVRIAQAENVIMSKPGGLDAKIEQNGRNLSGGQRQRLTIARALVKKSPVLIMDDSSSALDFATDAALRRAIREKLDMTVFIVSQRTSSIMNADVIVVLDDGKMAGLGTHEELLDSCDIYREIYESQYPSDITENIKAEGGVA